MIKRSIVVCLLLGLTISLIGCASADKTSQYVKKQVAFVKAQAKNVRDHQKDYLAENTTEVELKVPDDLAQAKIYHKYDVPAVKVETDSMLQPPDSLVGLREYRQKHGVLGQVKMQAPLPVDAIHIQQKNNILEMTLDRTFEQAWANVATALKRQAFNVYGGSKAEQRFFVLEESRVIQIQLQPVNEQQTRVRILARGGEPASPAFSKVILDRMSAGLSGHKKREGVLAWVMGMVGD